MFAEEVSERCPAYLFGNREAARLRSVRRILRDGRADVPEEKSDLTGMLFCVWTGEPDVGNIHTARINREEDM